MNKLVSLRTCAALLGVHPLTLSRWLKRYPQVRVHRINSRLIVMRPSLVKRELTKLGVYPTRPAHRPRKHKPQDGCLSAAKAPEMVGQS